MAILSAALVGLLAVMGTVDAAAVPNRRGLFGPDPTIQQASSDLSYTYAGCYFDAVGSILSTLQVFSDPKMTPDLCIANCKAGNFDSAGLTTTVLGATNCWCAPANFFNLNKVSDSSCLNTCAGNSNLACGGYLTNILVYKKDIPRYSSISAASYSTSSSNAAYSASTSAAASSLAAYSRSTSAVAYSASTSAAASSLAAYSRSTSAAAYSVTSSLNAYSASTSAVAYSASTSAAQASLNAYSASQSAAAYSQSTAAAQASLNAYSASQSAAAYSQSTAAAQASLNAYSASQSAAAYSQSTAAAQASLNAYSQSTSAAAYSRTSSLNAYSASQSAAAYSQSTAAAQASLNAYSASQSAAAYSQSTSAAQAAASANAAAYSQSSSLAGYSASVSAAGAAQSASAYSASVSAASASASAANAAATQLPAGWTKSSVCVAEGPSGRALVGDFTSGSMTYSKCVNYCSSKGFKLAGLEYSNECFCGNELTNGAALSKTSNNCNMQCGGDQNSICGGSSALTLFTSDVSGLNADLNRVATSSSAAPVASATPLPAGWAVASSACIAEGTSGRAFDSATITGNDMTINKCLANCASAGFPYAGLEYAGECRCGKEISNGASLSITSNQCTMACSGDAHAICGGPNAISLYYNAAIAAAPASTSTVASTSAAAPSSTPVAPPLPAGWSVGSSSCIQEVSGRALTGARLDDPQMTPNKCAAFCASKGFTYAGVEYGQECYCGNSLDNGASTSLVSGQCNMACPGDASLICGGPNAIQLFHNPNVVAPSPSPSPAPSPSASAAPPALTAPASINGLANRGCIQEVSGRALTGDSKASDDMTLEVCGAYCTGKGFSMFGVEYGRECYCGNSFSNGGSASLVSGQCNMPCAGNAGEVCGGPNAINLYSA